MKENPMPNVLKPMPEFASESVAFAFWEKIESKAVRVGLPNLRP